MIGRNKKIALLFLLALSIIFVDQASKYLIRHSGGFYICNRSGAWGIPIASWLIIFSTIFLIIYLSSKFKILNSKKNQRDRSFKLADFIRFFKILSLGFIFLVGGGISNLIDRITLGCVVDFVDLRFWPVFNLADVFIFIGGITIIAKILNSKR